MTVPVRRAVVAGGLAIALAAAGCGGGSSSKPAYCQDRTKLQQSLGELKNLDVRTQGVSAATAKLKQVETDANALVASTRKEFAPQASALKSSLSTLESAVRSAAASPSAQTVGAAATALSGVGTAFTDLSNAVKSKC